MVRKHRMAVPPNHAPAAAYATDTAHLDRGGGGRYATDTAP
jgi:hypothetical protein